MAGSAWEAGTSLPCDGRLSFAAAAWMSFMAQASSPSSYNSGTKTLVFSYKIQAGDKAPGGIGLSSLVALSAGNWITDQAGNNARLSFATLLPATRPLIRVP